VDNPLAWPEIIAIVDPPAGSGITRRIPSETFERLDTVRVRLTASAAVANRFVSVDALDGDDNILTRVQSATAITAGQTSRITFARNIAAVLSGGTTEQLLPLPDVLYPPGCEFRVTVGNIDVGDQLSEVRLIVSRYPSGLWVPSRGAIPYRP